MARGERKSDAQLEEGERGEDALGRRVVARVGVRDEGEHSGERRQPAGGGVRDRGKETREEERERERGTRDMATPVVAAREMRSERTWRSSLARYSWSFCR